LNARLVRIGIAVGIMGFLLMFFLPILPFARAGSGVCGAAGYGGFSLCTRGGAYSGYQSIGLSITGWGALYSNWFANSQNWGGYVAPIVGSLTTWGVLITFAFPLVITTVDLVAPEIVRASKLASYAFAALGGFTVIISVLFIVSMISTLAVLGMLLSPVGVLMVIYGTPRARVRLF
jgi:hypothetical protein